MSYEGGRLSPKSDEYLLFLEQYTLIEVRFREGDSVIVPLARLDDTINERKEERRSRKGR